MQSLTAPDPRLLLEKESPGKQLARRLLDLGVERLGIESPLPGRSAATANTIASALLQYGGVVAVPPRKPLQKLASIEETSVGVLKVYWGRGDEVVQAVYTRSRAAPALLTSEELASAIPWTPRIVVDLSWLPRHKLYEELTSLATQVAFTANLLRSKWLSPRHLHLTSTPPGAAQWIASRCAGVTIHGRSTGELLDEWNSKRVLILDPYAPYELSESDAREADTVVLGGVVDRVPARGATSEAVTSKLIGDARVKPVRITLRGDTHGVPNRINSIVEIVLRVRYEGLTVDQAVAEAMYPKDARLRAYIEIARHPKAKREGVVDWSFYLQLREWMPKLRPKDFLKAARMAGVRVVGEPPRGEE